MSAEKVVPVGIKYTNKAPTFLEKASIELDLLGYTRIESGFSESELDDLARRCDVVMQHQRNEAGGEQYMKTTVESHIARAVIAYDDAFLKVCRHSDILKLVEHIMGAPVYLNQQNAILNPPGDTDYPSYYHRDFPYQHFTSSHPLCLTVLLCVDDFTQETGPTMMLPASHKIENFPDEKIWREHEVPLTAERGTYLIFDSMTFHRTGHNVSDHYRRAIVQVYSIPLIKQVINLPQMLQGRYKNDPELSKFFGYDFETADTVLDFRRRRGMLKEGLY